MIQAVLFDMDGLIFDTESVYKRSWQYAAAEQQLSISDDFYQQFIGVQDKECEHLLAEKYQHRIDMAQFTAQRDAHFHQQRQQGIQLKSGFDALFSIINSKGLKTALVTSSHLDDVTFNFAPTPYLSQFDVVITAEDVIHSKPAPDGYLLACHELNLQPHQCMVLEDSNQGIRSALAAGCQAVMIPDLLPPDENLIGKITVKPDLNQVVELL